MFSASANSQILVLIADEDADSRAISRIVDGINDADEKAVIRTLSEDALAEYIPAPDDSVSAIILLGRRAIESGFVVDSVPILLAGYSGDLNIDSDLPRISLNIDPAFVIDSVNKTGAPVQAIYTLRTSASENSAEDDALQSLSDVAVIFKDAEGERETARGWFDFLNTADAESDALWIIDDTFLDNTGTYRYMVETAWRNSMLVVSSIPSFATRGVSVGFIPVLPSYGELLINTATELVENNSFTPFQLLDGRTVRRVFNSRTLQRIGRSLPNDLDRGPHTDIVIE